MTCVGHTLTSGELGLGPAGLGGVSLSLLSAAPGWVLGIASLSNGSEGLLEMLGWGSLGWWRRKWLGVKNLGFHFNPSAKQL